MDSTAQTDAAKALVKAMVRAFYDDAAICVVDFLLEAKYLRDGHGMGKALHLTTKELRKILAFLKMEQLVELESVEGLVVTQDDQRVYRRRKTAHFWYMDLNRCVHIIRLKLHLIKSQLETSINQARVTSTYECPGLALKQCNGRYSELDVQNFPTNKDGEFLCQECHQMHQHNPDPVSYSYLLKLVDNRQDIEKKETHLRRFQTQMSAKKIGEKVLRPGIYDLLQKVQQITQQLQQPVTDNLPSDNGAQDAVAGGDLAPYDTTNFAQEAQQEFNNTIYVRASNGQRLVLDIELGGGLHAQHQANQGARVSNSHRPLLACPQVTQDRKPPVLGIPKPKRVCRNTTPYFLKDNTSRLGIIASAEPYRDTHTEEDDNSSDNEPPDQPAIRAVLQQFAVQETTVFWQSQEKPINAQEQQKALLDIIKVQCQRTVPSRSSSFPPSHSVATCTFAGLDRSTSHTSVDWQTCDSHGSIPKATASRQSSFGSLFAAEHFAKEEYLTEDFQLFDLFKMGATASTDFLQSFESLSLSMADSKINNATSIFPSNEHVNSRDWIPGMQANHLEVGYDPSIFQQSGNGEYRKMPALPTVPEASSTKKSNKWDKMHREGLQPPAVPAATSSASSGGKMGSKKGRPSYKKPNQGSKPRKNRKCGKGKQGEKKAPTDVVGAALQPAAVTNTTGVASAPVAPSKPPPSSSSAPGLPGISPKSGTGAAKPKRKRVYKKRPKPMPEVKVIVERYTPLDVLCQRGTLGNLHPGNKKYLELINMAKAEYRAAFAKAEKTRLAQAFVDRINGYGGRFLTKDKDGQWYIVANVVARNKAGQAMREENSEKSRKDKREKYKDRRYGKKTKKHEDGNEEEQEGEAGF